MAVGGLDFSGPPPSAAMPSAAQTKAPQPAAHPDAAIPHPNTQEYFARNFTAIAGEFKTDTIEAARFLLRAMTKEEREATLTAMREKGCENRESYHDYLLALLPAAGNKQAKQADSSSQNDTGEFLPYGAWTNFNSRLSARQREHYNTHALSILDKTGEGAASDKDKEVLRRYSGFGGIAAEGERGVLYDYYTSPPVARLVWRLLDKAGTVRDGAKILEPSCGTGVFFQLAPKDKALSCTGVELDARTAKIAQHLHGENSEILNMSFEAFNLSDKKGGFDHVIGNAPFGQRTASLAALDMPDEQSLDNYFVSRCIDNLAPGGTMALIAAPGVLGNKTNERFRLGVNKKAKFIGAVKLPDRGFQHSHTQVTPDILLFRKYPGGVQERMDILGDEAFKETPLYDADFVNGTHFEKHPRHIAGQVSAGTGQWGADEVKGEITPQSVVKILDSFSPAKEISDDVFDRIRETYPAPLAPQADEKESLDAEELKELENKTLRPGSVKASEKRVYVLTEDYEWLLASKDETLAGKIVDIKKIAEMVRAIREAMKAETPVDTVREKQEQCRELLSAYTQTHGALPVDDIHLKRFTREYPSVRGVYETLLPADDPLLVSENVYGEKAAAIDGHNAVVTALFTLREKMKDGTEENIRAFFPDSSDDLLREAREHKDVFLTSEGVFQLREDFIAGDAWEKIDALKEAAEKEREPWKKEKLLYGSAELEKAVGWTAIEDADFSSRSSWIPQEIVREWASSGEALGLSHLVNLAKNDEGKWGELAPSAKLARDGGGSFSVTGAGTWEEKADPLVYYLNGQKQRSRNIDTEAYNREHDSLFRSFVASHEAHREHLESVYNRAFKTRITAPVKTYPVAISGWQDAREDGSGKTLKAHQWQSVHHLYRSGRGISALGTGFGKTACAIALMSLLRQEGKAKRVFLQVPNNKVKDWIQEIKDVMPSLTVASIDPEEAGYSSREKRYAKYQAMARSNADIIIMPESAASEIQLSPENDKEVSRRVSLQYELEKEDSTARQRESAAMKGERKALAGKTNATISFEDFGCDALVVDEAHRYKNLFSSSLSRETGLNDGRQSAKAMSLYKKSEYIRQQNNGKNVFLLTATPLTNSPLEYYNMLQYIAPEELRKMGIRTIDGFIREFASIETGWLYDWGSGQVKQGRVLTGFKNLPALQDLFFAYTDLQNNPEAAGLEKPFSENRPHICGADEAQTGVIKAISESLDLYKSLNAGERQDQFPGENFLTFYSRMRTASLDLELYDPVAHKGWKNPKLETLARNAFDTYKQTKAGQVVFCDRVFSSDASFNIHEKIKGELVAKGFKEKEIVVVNGFTKTGGTMSDGAIEREVSKAISDYNAGKYKVIIGSTACIGEGVNLQKNSSAVHHFDIPFRPSDFIQRNGRIDRQGNEQTNVSLNTYLAAGTIDNYSVNLVQRKAGWIDQLLRTTSQVFTNPNDERSIDADELQLALTQEWGDKEAFEKRKADMERQKQEKIRAAREAQMKGWLKSLSLSRGSLQSLAGKESTEEYRKRLAQVKAIETSIMSSPLFSHAGLMESHEPFLYNPDSGTIFREGDIIITGSGRYVALALNHKKQELAVKELLSDEELSRRATRGYGSAKPAEKNFKVSELRSDDNGYSYNRLVRHIGKACEQTKKSVQALGSGDFYALPEGEKEKYYNTHIDIVSKSSGRLDPVVFSVSGDGSLNLRTAKYHYPDEGGVLNPFSEEGKAAIMAAMSKGISYNDHDDDIPETLGETIPELKAPVKKAIANAKKIQAQAKAAERMVADTPRLKTGARAR